MPLLCCFLRPPDVKDEGSNVVTEERERRQDLGKLELITDGEIAEKLEDDAIFHSLSSRPPPPSSLSHIEKSLLQSQSGERGGKKISFSRKNFCFSPSESLSFSAGGKKGRKGGQEIPPSPLLGGKRRQQRREWFGGWVEWKHEEKAHDPKKRAGFFWGVV